MQDNPYAPLPVSLNKHPPGQGGPPQVRPWEITEVLSEAWEKTAPNLMPMVVGWVGVTVLVFMVNMVIQMPLSIVNVAVQAMMPEEELVIALVAIVLGLIGAIPQFFLQMASQIGLTRMYLSVARGQPADLSMMTTGYDRIWTVLGAALLTGLAVFGGTLLLFIPGIILGLGLQMSNFLAIDTRLGAVDCLRASWKMMDGQKGSYFALMFIMGMINLIGLIPCGMGLLVTVPLSFVTIGIVYTRVSGRVSELTDDPVLD